MKPLTCARGCGRTIDRREAPPAMDLGGQAQCIVCAVAHTEGLPVDGCACASCALASVPHEARAALDYVPAHPGLFAVDLVIENPATNAQGFFLYGWTSSTRMDGVCLEPAAPLDGAKDVPGVVVSMKSGTRLALLLHAFKRWRPGDGWVRSGGLVESMLVPRSSALMLTSLEQRTDTGGRLQFCAAPMRLEVFARFCWNGEGGAP